MNAKAFLSSPLRPHASRNQTILYNYVIVVPKFNLLLNAHSNSPTPQDIFFQSNENQNHNKYILKEKYLYFTFPQ